VKSGIDWLKSKTIHIHQRNCPETVKEIQSYKWREDKDGNIFDEPVEFNDHSMAALRYSIDRYRRHYGSVNRPRAQVREW